MQLNKDQEAEGEPILQYREEAASPGLDATVSVQVGQGSGPTRSLTGTRYLLLEQAFTQCAKSQGMKVCKGFTSSLPQTKM